MIIKLIYTNLALRRGCINKRESGCFMTGRVPIPAESLSSEIQNLQKAIQAKSESSDKWMDSDCAQKIQSVASKVCAASENRGLEDKEALAFLDVLNSREFQVLAEGPKRFVTIRTFLSRIFNEYFGTTESKSSWEFAKEVKKETEKALFVAKPNIVKVKIFEDLAKEHKTDIEKTYRDNRAAIQHDSGKLDGFAKLLKVVGSDIKVDYAINDEKEPLSYEEICLIKEYLPKDLQEEMEKAFRGVEVLGKKEEAVKSGGDSVVEPKAMRQSIHPADFASNVFFSTVIVSPEEKAKKEAGCRCATAVLQAINEVKGTCESEAAKQKEVISEGNQYLSIPWSLLEFSEIKKLGGSDVSRSLQDFKRNFEMLARRKSLVKLEEAGYEVVRTQQQLPDTFKSEINAIFQSDDWKLCMGELKDSS